MLIAEVVYVLFQQTRSHLPAGVRFSRSDLGATLFGPYMLGVELASMVLLAGLVGAYHLGRRRQPDETTEAQEPRRRSRRRTAQEPSMRASA